MTLFGGKIADYVQELFVGKDVLDELVESQKDFDKALDDTKVSAAVKNVQELRIELDLAKKGFIDKDETVKHYNDTIGKTTGAVKDLDEAEQALVKNGEAYIKLTLLKAAANIAQDEAAKSLVEAEKKRQEGLREQAELASRPLTNKALVQNAKDQNAALVKEQEDNAKKQQSIVEKFLSDAAKISSEFGLDFFQDGDLNGSADKFQKYLSKLTNLRRQAEIDELKDIAAFREAVSNSESFGLQERLRSEQTASDAQIKIIQLTAQNQIEEIRRNAQKEVEERQKANEKIISQQTELSKKLNDPKLNDTGRENIQRRLRNITEGYQKSGGDIGKIEADAAQQQINIEAQRDRDIEKLVVQSLVKVADLKKEYREKEAKEIEAGYQQLLEAERKGQQTLEQQEAGRTGLAAFNVDIIKKNAESAARAIETAYLEEQTLLTNQYNKGKISFQKYQDGLQYIQVKYALKSAVDARAAAIDQLQYLRPLSKEYEELQKQIADYDLQIQKLQQSIKSLKREQLAEELENIAAVTQNFTSAISNLNNIRYDNQKAQLNEIEALNERNYQNEVDRINRLSLSDVDRAAMLQRLEATRQAQQAVNQQKQRAADNAKARFDKEVSILNIITSTAAAVVKALPNIPLAVSVGILGASQLVAAVATKVPQYKHGLKGNKPAHFGIYGEAGPERVTKPGEEPFIATQPVFDWLPANTRIEPISQQDINRSISTGLHQQNLEIVYYQKRNEQEKKQNEKYMQAAAYNTRQIVKAIKGQSKPTVVNVNLQKQLDYLDWKRRRSNW